MALVLAQNGAGPLHMINHFSTFHILYLLLTEPTVSTLVLFVYSYIYKVWSPGDKVRARDTDGFW